ncbi:hypothetical protein [Actinoplanes sp. DH11]|uniref:hypothetical protein n=1 Tax=Actinoplanes sp. DH11 TaxID=2857011 RepID=UPI001E2BA0BC|nr:hypothetical protein [Actinoplanes sp. DH11]
MDEPGPRCVVEFVRSVAVLALEANTQVAWLQKLGATPSADELALEFADGLRLTPIFIERGWVEATAVPALTQLDDQLNRMSGEAHAHLWRADALFDRAEWDRVRELARAALILLA